MTVLRRLAALLVLVGLVVAAPIALWTWGRPLLPDHIPSLNESWRALTEQDTGALFMGALVVVGWIAWLVFTLAVLVEVAAALADLRGGGRSVSAVRGQLLRIPVMRAAQGAATVLVGAVLATSLLTPGMAMASSPAGTSLPVLQPRLTDGVVATASLSSAAPAASQQASAPGLPRPASAPSSMPIGPAWQVRSGDTLWDIAGTALGDPLRYSEIVELNRDRPQADGGRLSTADVWLETAWVLALPDDAKVPAPAVPAVRPAAPAHTVTVQPGDTLSGIAQQELGSAEAYSQLAAANQLSDADYLDVGQVLYIPATPSIEAAGPAIAAAPIPQQTAPTPASSPESTSASRAPEPRADTVPAAPVTEPEPAASAAAPATAAAPSAPTAPAGAPAAAPTPSATTPASVEDDDSLAAAGLLSGAAGLTLAAVLAGIIARRRRNARGRRPGRVPVADLASARVEKALRDRHVDGHDPLWVDRSLRAMLTAADSAAFPDVIGAVVKDDELRVLLASPLTAPAPFIQDGREWVLSTTVDPSSVDDGGVQAAPLPALATVAVTSDRAFLLDLERAQALHVMGPPAMCREYLTHLAVDLATNLWSDTLELTLVGWGQDLTGLNPSRVTHLPTIAAATALLQAWLAEVAEAMVEAGTDATSARGGQHGDFFTPLVLIVDADDSDPAELEQFQQHLNELTTVGRAATAVILTGAQVATDAVEVQLHADGHVTVGDLWPEVSLRAPRMNRHDLEQLVPSLQAPVRGDVPAEPAGDPAPWAENMTVLGGLQHRAGPAAAEDTEAAASDDLGEVDASTCETTGEHDAPSEHAIEDLEQTAAVVDIRPGATKAAHQLARTLATDPDLDADLDAWTGQLTDGRPRIAVLGPPVLTATGTPPSERIPRNTELAVYLALHPRGITAERMATDLWPETSAPAPGTIRELMSTLRKWLGRDGASRQYLPTAKAGVYRLPERLLDSELLRRLHKRAQARADAADSSGALADYVKALELIRLDTDGVPLWEYTGQAYSWLRMLDHSDARHMSATILDVAAEAADLALALGDLPVARWAADLGHTVDPESDRPLCQLLLIATAAGQMDTATRLVGEIFQANDAAALEECTQWAREAIAQAFPAGLPRHAVGR